MAEQIVGEMPKSYDPKLYEEEWYRHWESRGYFRPEINPVGDPFCIIMPPPNVTGELHIGHALTASIEDILTRWHRMMGDAALWLPGEDHAAIAAQNVVERELAKEGLTRHDLGREAFIQRMWDWVHRYRHIIADQHRRLGASCDWTRERFTMDPGPSLAVRTTFKQLYDRGLIYRGNRIVNWCPRCSTALSDLEVVHSEEEGTLTYVKYPLEPREGESTEPEYVVVATTRPETILGDTGIAVHPEDARYADTIGRKAVVPEIGRRIPIVADEAVDPAFGSGAVKVTPGHDPTDFEIGLRHHLPVVLVIGPDDKMTKDAGKFAGMNKLEARKALVADLEAAGQVLKVEPLRHSVGHCQRCGTVAEPLVSEQWYVKIRPLSEPAAQAVRDGRTRIIPERFSKVYYNWMDNIRDWCISRQLWWGHRIPVWYCDGCGEVMVEIEEPTSCKKCGGAKLRQDPDVLDTWFSSGLWPLSTLGWPEDTEDLRKFYPTSVMETGYDILFFWVARMMMQCMAMHPGGEVPFKDVYLHGLVRIDGEKMSKSKGNVVNPLEVIDSFGTDALRFALVTGTTPGNDSQMSMTKIEASRNFANKLWNAARFVVANVPDWQPGDLGSPMPLPEGPGASDADRWIVSRLNAVAADTQRMLESFQLGEAARNLHDFIWGEYCDWYIEIAKVQIREAGGNGSAGDQPLPYDAGSTTRNTLAAVLERSLRLLHPFMPFVTEEVWQSLVGRPANKADSAIPASIMLAPWVKAGERDLAAEAQMERAMEVVRGIRNTRAEYGVDPARFVPATLVAGEWADRTRAQSGILSFLARVQPLEILEGGDRPHRALSLIASGVEVYLPVEGLFDLEQEKARMARELESAEGDVTRAEALLAKPGFADKAPAHVVAKEQERLEAHRDRLSKLRDRIAMLEKV